MKLELGDCGDKYARCVNCPLWGQDETAQRRIGGMINALEDLQPDIYEDRFKTIPTGTQIRLGRIAAGGKHNLMGSAIFDTAIAVKQGGGCARPD